MIACIRRHESNLSLAQAISIHLRCEDRDFRPPSAILDGKSAAMNLG